MQILLKSIKHLSSLLVEDKIICKDTAIIYSLEL